MSAFRRSIARLVRALGSGAFPWILAIASFILLEAILLWKFSLVGLPARSITFGDLVAAWCGGMQFYRRESGLPFIPPFEWFLLCLAMLYIPLRGATADLEGYGRLLLVKMGSRWRFWSQRFACTVTATIAYWLLGLLISFITCLFIGGRLTLGVTDDAVMVLLFDISNGPVAPGIGTKVAVFLVGAAAMSVALACLQLTLCFAFSRVVAYTVSAAMLFTSAFFPFRFLPGNYLMLARTAAFVPDGVDPLAGLIGAAACAFACYLVGGALFHRIDIIERGAGHDR